MNHVGSRIREPEAFISQMTGKITGNCLRLPAGATLIGVKTLPFQIQLSTPPKNWKNPGLDAIGGHLQYS